MHTLEQEEGPGPPVRTAVVMKSHVVPQVMNFFSPFTI
jgi:hypothetical protein